MRDRHEKRNRRLDIDPVDESAIRRKTVIEVLQQPMTLLPLAISAISALYLALLSPIFGGTVVALILSAASGSAATISFISNYRRIHPMKARQMIEALDEERKRLEEADLEQLNENLRADFLNINFKEGLKNLASLTARYKQLRPALNSRRASDPLAISIVPALAGETYRRGLSVLSDVLELMKVARLSDKDQLEQEIAQLEMEINLSKEREAEEEQAGLKQEKLASDRERLEVLDRLHLHIEQLLHQARRCEAALENTQIELTTARVSGSKAGVDSVIKALQRTIRQVKEVQDELDKLTQQLDQ